MGIEKFLYLDFEYYNSSHQYLTPVCLTTLKDGKEPTEFWLYGNKTVQEAARLYLLQCHHEGYVFVSYAFEAEARAMQALGINPLAEKIKCLCLYIMYRQLANHFPATMYGNHLIRGKKKLLLVPKKTFERSIVPDDEKASNEQMEYGLVSATYKFTGEIRNPEEKEACRDRILQGGPYTQAEADKIMKYCTEDVIYLPKLHEKMIAEYRKTIPESNLNNLMRHSFYAVRTAEMVRLGYPINREWLEKISQNVDFIGRQNIRECLAEAAKDPSCPRPYSWIAGKHDFVRNNKIIMAYIEKAYPSADRTEPSKTHPNGQISLSEESLERLKAPPGHKKGLVDHLLRVVKLKRSLTGFKPAKGQRTIWDSVGPDDRVRPYFGIFGAQTSRTQPSSTSFIFLKSAALRFLVSPKPGRCIVAIDYAAQEFLIGALLSNDTLMRKAYESGDPYISLAKYVGAVPQTATKATHPNERDLWKGVELSLSYGMGPDSMSYRIGRPPHECRQMIDQRANVYRNLIEYRKATLRRYEREGRLRTKDGWWIGPANPNSLSTLNFEGQGNGAAVMRRAVERCQDKFLDIIQTLHDALYAECDIKDLDCVIETMDHEMKEGFFDVMGYRGVRTDIHVWGLDRPRDKYKTKNGVPYLGEKHYYDAGKTTPEEWQKWFAYVQSIETEF